MNGRPSIWPVVVASLTGLAVLLSLGVWQVQRLTEKNAQIAIIDQRIAAPPKPLHEALRMHEAGQDIEYVKVALAGVFLDVPPVLKLTTYSGGPGYEVIQPFLTDDRHWVPVDRGAIPIELKNKPLPARAGEIQGILRFHRKGQGIFDGENNPASNEWYWWDMPAMVAALNPPAEVKVATLIVQLVSPNDGMPPFPAPPKAELRNNHMGYALTWFGLAAALAVISILFVRQRRIT